MEIVSWVVLLNELASMLLSVQWSVRHLWPGLHFIQIFLQMTLDLTTFYGYTVVDVVSIAGFVMEKQEGNACMLWRFSLI